MATAGETLNILAWDLECSSLNADYGIILCAGFKTVGKGKVEILSISDYPKYLKNPTDDKQLCKDISKKLMEADAWLTHYGGGFDVPFLNTRLLYHGLPPVPASNLHIDTWRTARNRLKLRNNRLVTIQEFLGLKNEKDAVKGPVWIRAIAGHLPSLQSVINHCKKDVLVLEETYMKLRALIIDHPRQPHGACTVCGSNKLHARGFHRTVASKYQRFQCQNCGRWSRSGSPLVKKPLSTPRAM